MVNHALLLIPRDTTVCLYIYLYVSRILSLSLCVCLSICTYISLSLSVCLSICTYLSLSLSALSYDSQLHHNFLSILQFSFHALFLSLKERKWLTGVVAPRWEAQQRIYDSFLPDR